MGISDFFSRLTGGLTKTRQALVERLQSVLVSSSALDAATVEQLQEVMLGADIGVATTDEVIKGLKRRAAESHESNSDRTLSLLKGELRLLLQSREVISNESLRDVPQVILIVGVNGAGKTTTVGKLAHWYKQSNRRVIIGAADTFRAAANEQLGTWAKRAGVELVQQRQGADPGSVAFDTVQSAIAKQADVVLIDTAGRLHTSTSLMEEIAKVRRVLEKKIPGAPHEVLLVLDAATGQNGLQQARQFSAAVGVTGIVLTKFDGTAKGGIVFAIAHELNIPIRYIGVGEDIEDLQPFDADAFIQALFDGVPSPQEVQ